MGTMPLGEPITRSQVCLSDTHVSCLRGQNARKVAPIHTQGLSPHRKQEGIPLTSPHHLPVVALRSCGPCLCQVLPGV